MQQYFIVAVMLFLGVAAGAQHTIKATIKNKDTGEPVPGATMSIGSLRKETAADSAGLALLNEIPTGKYIIKFSSIGYASTEQAVDLNGDIELTIEMEQEHEEEEEVVIQSTRSTRTIQDIPTRVEFVAGEELDEKANMKPGDIRMVLNESTGITTQQTSATSANSSIRIQGLDGRYTQILKDGFPLYAGFSGGLGLLQTPPLDLKQFEVIKGSSSTLYGGGAIAGLVNLISKTPADERELRFHVDITSGGGLNTSGFYGKRNNKTGITLFASRNSNSAYDPSDVGLTAIPKFERYTVNPKVFFYINEQTDLQVGLNLTKEDRTGGDINYIKGKKLSGYSEENNTDRMSTQFSLERRFGENRAIKLKNSFGFFQRTINEASSYMFAADQTSSFSELTYSDHGERSEWIFGINLLTDHFEENPGSSSIFLRDYRQTTTGVFVQNNLKATNRFSLETGLRGDYVNDYGFAILPRLSMLFTFTPKLSSRIGGGMGYKTPTIFTEDAERILYRNVLPIDPDENKLEKSYGLNADINYRTSFSDDKISFAFNHLFFYTRIHDPLILQRPFGASFYFFQNVDGHFDSRGMETNVKIGYSDFKLFLGYTLTKAYLHEGSAEKENYLTPRHRLNSVLLYEVEDKWKIGLEAYYFSKQQLSDGVTGRSYWVTGFMAEKLWEKFSLYINFENFTDSRQTRFDTIYTGTIDNPQFRDIYAPLDGFVMNGGVKIRL
ncbi:MAG TPA: TonB-dependent receptor [Chitinophagaceae bacterium]|nr:TonB-dependent receptor [Chitinophagaceae bacterium]